MKNVGISKNSSLEAAVNKYNHLHKMPSSFATSNNLDLFQYLSDLTLQYKSDTSNNIFKYDNSLHNHPCILKMFKPSDNSPINLSKSLSSKWPTGAKTSPIVCASVQYMLTLNYPKDDYYVTDTRAIIDNANAYHCDCKDCLLMAFNQYYCGGTLKLKK